MNYLEKYGYTPCEEEIAADINVVASGLATKNTPENLLKCFSFMDLTTLRTNDTEASITKFVNKVNRLSVEYPSYPLPASICVFPNFVKTVKDVKDSDKLHVTATAGCFPSSQSFIEVKVKECEMAVESGADEVDIVMAHNAFAAGDYETAAAEIRTMRAAMDAVAARQGRSVILKVILETGILESPEKIAQAAFLAMESGADFIKTSTGKVSVNATPMSALVMCKCIKAFYEKTGRKVGFKAAGGISTDKDALSYYSIVENILGQEWLCRKYFRIGCSRLGNSLMSAIESKTVTYF